MNSLFSDQVRRIAFVPQHATDASQDRWLTWLAWGCLAVYAVFFFAFTDATTHTVDGVRDFEVARSIARGEFFPIVSQPFAGRFQTLPAYFYFIAIPIMLGGEEHAVMLWIAAICFASVCLLRWQLAKSFGRTVGNLYTITACVFPTSIFLHSLTNPSLAYAFSGLILACVLALWRGERRWGGVLVLALVLIVQMHLSSLPLLVAVGLVALRFHRRMLSRGAWVMALLCVALCGFWLMQYGYLASNALPQESASANATATGLASGCTRLDMDVHDISGRSGRVWRKRCQHRGTEGWRRALIGGGAAVYYWTHGHDDGRISDPLGPLVFRSITAVDFHFECARALPGYCVDSPDFANLSKRCGYPAHVLFADLHCGAEQRVAAELAASASSGSR